MDYKLGLGIVAASAGLAAYNTDTSKHSLATGAAVGAAGALGGLAIGRMYGRFEKATVGRAMWKYAPGKSMAALAVGAVGALGIGSMMNQPTYESTSQAIANNEGGYNPQLQSQNYQYSLSDRLASMNISGDIVFGLHNKRHG